MTRGSPGGLGTDERTERPSSVKPPTTEPVPGSSGTRRRLALVLGALFAVVVVGGFALVWVSSGPADQAPGPLVGPRAPIATTTPLPPSVPVAVHVPSIGADSSLVPVGVDAQRQVQVPPVSQPMQAAWFDPAPTPGAPGPALILGHVNGGGRPGIFAHLSDVRDGQQIEVDRADGHTAVFTVFETELAPKDAFPTQRVYGYVPEAQLRLVTCGGELDTATNNYLSNVIVYATLTGVR